MEKQVQLGKSDLFVNPIGLGTNAVGGHNIYPDTDEEAGKELVRTAINNGINFIDTAYFYGIGRSEELIGEVIKETGRRSDLVLASKVSPLFNGDNVLQVNTPSFLKKEVEASLKRLQTDYIDLMYIHFPDENTPKDEAVLALQDLKQEGKIRSIGVSNFNLQQLKEANQHGYVDIFQGKYNLIEREAKDIFFPYCEEKNISFVPYFPLASGLLTGKYTKDTEISERHKKNPHFQGEAYLENLKKIERLREIASEKKVEVVHVVLAWYLTRGVIDAIIPGAKNAEQVLHNLRTLEVELTRDEIAEIDRIFN